MKKIFPFLLLAISLLFHQNLSADNVNDSKIILNAPLEIYQLSGKWRFLPEDKEEFMQSDYNDSEWKLVNVPGQWNNMGLSGFETAWYRMKFSLSEEFRKEKLSIMVPLIADSHELYINGIFVGKIGEIGKDGKAIKKSSRPNQYAIPPEILFYDKENTIALRISDNVGWGGIVTSEFYLGKRELVENTFYKFLMWNIAIGVSLLFFSIYYLILWVSRTKEKSYLYFFYFAFVTGMTLIGSSSLPYFLYDNFWFNHFVFHTGLNSLAVLVLLFFHKFFDYPIGKITKFIMGIYIPIFTIYTFTFFSKTAMTVYSKVTLGLSLVLIVLTMIYVIYITIDSVKKKALGAKTIAVGEVVLLLAIITGAFSYLQILHTDRYLMEGFLFFTMSMSFAMSFKFAHVYDQTDKLKIVLEEKNIELTQLDKLKDDFLANTSHELRTPLNGIIGIAESLMDGATGKLSDETNQNLSMITLSGKRLANLVNSILDFSKMKEKTIALSLKPVSVKQAVELSIAMAKPLLGEKAVKLINEINADRFYANADENRFQQILLNIIGNSVKFTESGYVKVSAKQEGDFISIAIEDTGIGIPKDKFEKIFQAFEQVDASTSREYGGTGLGLSITKSLIELHGGKIKVDSEIGKGSVFTVYIPLANINEDAVEISVTETVSDSMTPLSKVALREPQGDTLPYSPDDAIGAESIVVTPEYKGPDRRVKRADVATDKAHPRDTTNHKFRILAVDDEPINLQVLTNQLTLEGFEVMTAANGMKALEIIENSLFLPELILLDVMMPRMSGYEVCQKIREKHPIAELPIIMLTAKNQLSNLLEGLSLGANDYISKPFSKNELVARIKTHLNVSNISIAYGKFVPMEILNHLNKDSIIELHLGDQIQKEMTIMFSDIRAFTNLSETMTPQENFNFLNAYLSRVSPMIRKNNGYIDKFIGDAIMALFAKDAEDGLQASIDMQREIREYNKHRLKKNYEPISTGIGLHTGMLMLGTIGDKDRMEGTVISDAVNLASRVESLSKMYGSSILITDSVFQKIADPDKYYFRVLDRVVVKGKREAVQVIEILNGQPDYKLELFMNTKQYFEMAINSYLMKEFSSAKSMFEKVLENNQADVAAKLYLKRADYYMEHGVPIDWEGVEVMDHK